jgi:hypothetical protein
MTQGRDSLRLSLKTLLETCFADKFRSDHLQSTMHGQAGVKGFVHVGHTAPPQALDNLILSNRLPY